MKKFVRVGEWDLLVYPFKRAYRADSEYGVAPVIEEIRHLVRYAEDSAKAEKRRVRLEPWLRNLQLLAPYLTRLAWNRDIMWVTPIKKVALEYSMRYGTPVDEIPVGHRTVVVGDDDEDGYLVILDHRKTGAMERRLDR